MTEQEFKALMEILERIAKALETANVTRVFTTPSTNPPPPPYPTGYTCVYCGCWVPYGNYHACSNTNPYPPYKITWTGPHGGSVSTSR